MEIPSVYNSTNLLFVFFIVLGVLFFGIFYLSYFSLQSIGKVQKARCENLLRIGLATKSFRFFPLDDLSRSKSFFSIANFRPYMVFDSKCFIDYPEKKSFVVYSLLYIDLKWRFQTVIFVTFYFITSEEVKMQFKLEKSCVMYMVENL